LLSIIAKYCPSVTFTGMSGRDDAIASRSVERIGARIRRRRRELGLTQQELARAANVNQGYLSSIERGLANATGRMIDALSIALDLPQGVLIGGGSDHDPPQPLETLELPLFGSIPAGAPSSTQEQLEMFPVLRHQWSPDYYCLRLSFDSMEPTLKPGDIVLVHYRPGVEPEHVQGRVCACLVDGEPTLKRVTVEWQNGHRVVILRGDNPRTVPLLIDGSKDFSIQGVVSQLVCRDL
jgi:SOS-response transcriptional repressor LexA